jgi:hypothetical protein
MFFSEEGGSPPGKNQMAFVSAPADRFQAMAG